MAYKELCLTSNKIEKYLEAPERVKHLLKANNTALTVRIAGLYETEEQEALSDRFISPERADRTVESLACLAHHLKGMNRMDTFRLQLYAFRHRLHVEKAGPIPTIISTLLAHMPRSLSRLTLDCHSKYPTTVQQSRGAECPSSFPLNKQSLPCLRHLRLRNRFICPEIFKTICSGESQLETLIINLSVRVEQWSPPMNTIFFSTQCHGKPVGHGSGDLRTSLSNTAIAILPQLTRIKALKILQHKLPSDDVISYDVLTGRTVLLPELANWEEADCQNDGEPDPDCEERSENSFPSSDSEDDSG